MRQGRGQSRARDVLWSCGEAQGPLGGGGVGLRMEDEARARAKPFALTPGKRNERPLGSLG